MHGTKLFANHASLTLTPQSPGIRYDKTGAEVAQPYDVWTGTGLGGRAGASDCGEWTGALDSDLGTAGIAGTWDRSWTDGSILNCDVSAHLYCFEQ